MTVRPRPVQIVSFGDGARSQHGNFYLPALECAAVVVGGLLGAGAYPRESAIHQSSPNSAGPGPSTAQPKSRG